MEAERNYLWFWKREDRAAQVHFSTFLEVKLRLPIRSECYTQPRERRISTLATKQLVHLRGDAAVKTQQKFNATNICLLVGNRGSAAMHPASACHRMMKPLGWATATTVFPKQRTRARQVVVIRAR